MRRSRMSGLLLGIAAGVLGLAPWLATGGQLPLQNLWHGTTMPDDMPFSLLPISQYESSTILSILCVGALVAGIGLSVLRGDTKRMRTGALLGLALAHLIALVQSFVAVSAGLGLFDGSLGTRETVYLVGMFGGATACSILAIVLLRLLATPGIPRAIALVLVSYPFIAWVLLWVALPFDIGMVPQEPLIVARWLPPVLIGLVAGLLGFRRGWPLIWVFGVIVAVVVPGLITAVQAVLGTRAMMGMLAEQLDMGVDIFVMTLGINVVPGIVALVVTAVVAGLTAVVQRRDA